MKLCAVQRQQHLQTHSGVCRDPLASRLPCAMSTDLRQEAVNGLCGGGPSPPSPHMPPSSPLRAPPSLPTSPTKQQLLSPPDTNGEDKAIEARDEMIKKENVEVDGGKVGDWKERIKLEEKDVIKQETTDSFVKVKKEIKGESLGQENNAVTHQAKPTTGGRLKFFKEGRVLLELTHRLEGEKGVWVPTTKKVYWPPGPPPAPTHRLDSNASSHTGPGSEGSLDNASVHSHPSLSPWQPNSPRPSSHFEEVSAPSPRPTPSWQPAPPHRVKSKPVKCINPPQEMLFALKTLQGIKNYRKKMRTFRRKCRNPLSEIRIGTFLLKLECNAASVPTSRRKPSSKTPSQRSSRLETVVTKVSKHKSSIHVPITAWKAGRTDLSGLVKGPPSAPSSPVQAVRGVGINMGQVGRSMGVNMAQVGNRVRSELRPVTETCTAAMATVTTSRFVSKVKAETRTVTAETRHVPVKTLPVTPTVARIKSDPSKSTISSSLVANVQSPDIARVKMEVCHAPQGYIERGHGGHAPLNYLDRDPSFASPRKRFLREFENGSPSAKNRRLSSEHRLSTDSMGSSDRSSPGGVAGYRDSPGGVAGYREPYRPTPSPSQLSPAPRAQASPRPSAKVSNFSIDSIMGGGGRAPSSPTPSRLASVKRENAPSSPSRSPSHQLPLAPTPTRPSPTPLRTPPPSRTPPPVNPYAFPSLYPHPLNHLIDPRLAHLSSLTDPRLASLADPRLAALADPRLAASQSPYPFPLMSGMPAFPGMSPYLTAPTSLPSSYPNLWTPPVSTPRTLPRPPSPSNPPICTTASSSTFFPPSSSSLPPSSSQFPPSSSSQFPPSSFPPSSSSFQPSSSSFPPHASQYRGEPKLSQRSQGLQEDAPLNLSMKK